MAKNSKRELILLKVVDLMESISSIVTVERIRLGFNDLGNYSGEQLPLIAVVGSLPKPRPKKSGRTPGVSDAFISSINIDIYCYAMDNENPDSLVSNLADDIWAKVWSDPILTTTKYPKGLTIDLDVDPEIKVGIWDPYIVFKIACVYKYVHGIGGI